MPLVGKLQRAIVRARFYLRRHPDRADGAVPVPAVIPARAPVDEQRVVPSTVVWHSHLSPGATVRSPG